MIRTFLLLCAWSLSVISQAQITLESCKQQARENYPLVRQYDLIQAVRTIYALKCSERQSAPNQRERKNILSK